MTGPSKVSVVTSERQSPGFFHRASWPPCRPRVPLMRSPGNEASEKANSFRNLLLGREEASGLEGL